MLIPQTDSSCCVTVIETDGRPYSDLYNPGFPRVRELRALMYYLSSMYNVKCRNMYLAYGK